LIYTGVLLLAMFSCKAPKTLTTVKLKPVGTNKLIRNIEENAFQYEGLEVKRITCQYETSDDKLSFKANLKMLKDKYILMTLSKLNIPVGRLLLTPDSVKMVNYIEKSYFLKDYGYLSKFVNADIDFYDVQSILANDIFSYRDDQRDNDFKEFVSYADSGLYVLQSLKNRKLEKIKRKQKDEKIDRYLKKLDEENFIVQYLYVDPVTYKIRQVILDDKSADKKLRINFSDFEPVQDQLYPGNIEVRFTAPEDYLRIKIRLSKFSTESDPDIHFNIPDKYKQEY